MDIISTQKFIRMSPKKIRFVSVAVKKMTLERALNVLPLMTKRASTPLLKVIKCAVANAKNKGVSVDNLEFKEIQINEAPRLKRGRPASRGMWHPYKRRMSHIRVVLTTKKSDVQNTQSDTEVNKNKKLASKTRNPLRALKRKRDKKQKGST